MKKSKKGFTLTEVIVVVAIIVILAGAAAFGIGSSIKKYKESAQLAENHNIRFEGVIESEINNPDDSGVPTASPSPTDAPEPTTMEHATPTNAPTATPVPGSTNTPTPSPTPAGGGAGGGDNGGGTGTGTANLNCYNNNSGALKVSASGNIKKAVITFPAGYNVSVGSCDWRYSSTASGNTITLNYNGNGSPISSIDIYNLSWSPDSQPSGVTVTVTYAD